MFGGIVGLIGLTPFFLITLMLATFTAPASMVLKRFRPILGALGVGLGVVGQVAYGVIVALSLVSDTIWNFFIGLPQ